MKVKTNIGKSDYYKAFKFAAMQIDAYKRALILTLVLIPVLFVMLSFSYSIQYQTTFKFVLTSLVIGIVFDVAILCFIKWAVLKKLQHEKTGTVGERIIEIDEKAVSITASEYSGYFSWGLAHSIEIDKKYIYIFTGALNAIIVPIKAFSKASEASEFFDKCVSYFKAANTSKTVSN